MTSFCMLKFAAWFPCSRVFCSPDLLLRLRSLSPQHSSGLMVRPHPQSLLSVGSVGTLGAGMPLSLLPRLDKVKLSIAPISGLVQQSWQAGQGRELSTRRRQTSLLISCLREVWEKQEKWQHAGHWEDAHCVLWMPKAMVTWAAAHQGTGQSRLCPSGSFLPGGTAPGTTRARPASVTRRERSGQVPQGDTLGRPRDASSSAGFPADEQTLGIV